MRKNAQKSPSSLCTLEQGVLVSSEILGQHPSNQTIVHAWRTYATLSLGLTKFSEDSIFTWVGVLESLEISPDPFSPCDNPT